MRVVFAGTPEVALPSLDAIVRSEHEVVAVVTRPDAPAGRGRRLEASPVKARAEELGLPIGNAVDFWTEASLFSAAGYTTMVYGPGDIAQAHTADWRSLFDLPSV